jgi:hypothetical protein
MLTRNEAAVLKLLDEVPRTVKFCPGEIVPDDAYAPPFTEP